MWQKFDYHYLAEPPMNKSSILATIFVTLLRLLDLVCAKSYAMARWLDINKADMIIQAIFEKHSCISGLVNNPNNSSISNEQNSSIAAASSHEVQLRRTVEWQNNWKAVDKISGRIPAIKKFLLKHNFSIVPRIWNLSNFFGMRNRKFVTRYWFVLMDFLGLWLLWPKLEIRAEIPTVNRICAHDFYWTWLRYI